ncbi:MAG: BirA family transcriptional regulator [Actinomycetota bacterium]|nr:BirA family transcriptional regulator [Actinomycetota bacterium]
MWADDQTAGRGRWGRKWVSAPGDSLTFSLVLRPPFGIARLGLVTVAAGVACAEGIERITGLATKTKWPNDVLIDGKKVAGILCESLVSGDRFDAIVVGVGINLALPPSLPQDVAERATSLASVLGTSPRSEEVMRSVLDAFGPLYTSLSNEELDEDSPFLGVASSRCDTIDKEVIVHWPDGRVETGVAAMILPSGALYVIDMDAGEAFSVDAAEVEHLRET